MSTILITGCNRGIGLQLCKQLHDRGDDVIGVCRAENDALQNLGIRLVTGIDVGRDDSMPVLKAAIGEQIIDIRLRTSTNFCKT